MEHACCAQVTIMTMVKGNVSEDKGEMSGMRLQKSLCARCEFVLLEFSIPELCMTAVKFKNEASCGRVVQSRPLPLFLF